MAYMAKGAVRSIKNFSKGYSDIQAKVRTATSNDAWGPSGTAMDEIAQATYSHHEFIEIMEMIDKRLNDHDYCLHVGSENVVLYAKDNLYIVKTLREFQFVDEYGKDQGANVRQKAKDITNLLLDDERLKAERRSRATMRDRLSGRNEPDIPLSFDRGISEDYDQPGYFDDSAQYQRAIEESKRSAQEHEKKLKESLQEQQELEKAIQLSKDEEEKRKKATEAARQESNLLQFDTGFNETQFGQQHQQQQQQQQQVDLFNEQLSNNQFSQFANSTPGQQQYDLFTLENQQNQQDFNSYNQTGFSTNPYQQQLLQLQLQQQQNNSFQQQFLQQQQSASTTTVGSNNPFGPFTGQQQSFGSNSAFGSTVGNQPTFNNDSLQLQSQQNAFTTPTFNLGFDSTFGNGHQSSTGFQNQSNQQNQSLQQQTLKPQDEKHSKLNSLLAMRGDGLDTFGNTGDLRVPAGTGFSTAPLRSNSTSSIGSSAISQANPFYKNELTNNLNAPYLGTFSSSQPNLSLSSQNNANSDLYSNYSGSTNFSSTLSQPGSPFSANSYATNNSLIDFGTKDDRFTNTQTSKNPFQTQQPINSSTNVAPKSLKDLQFEQVSLQQQQQTFNSFGQPQSGGFGRIQFQQ
ncbi:hypothetical protein G9A89_017543 [Geosiphon pyriformis]|nr:hypothetical protein G9A89_017543 [Geosiphon pyriformis]